MIAKLAKNVVEPSMWSHNVSNNYAAAVFGMSDSYLSTVSKAKLTNSSGSSLINAYSSFDVIKNG